MVRTSDLLAIGGIGLIAFLVLRGGRDLFGALPSLAQGIGDSGQGVLDFFGQAGEGIQSAFGGGNGDSVAIQNPVSNPIAQEVVSESFSSVSPEQQSPFDALGAGLGGLFSSIAGIVPSSTPEPELPPLQGPVPDVDSARFSLTNFARSFEPQITPDDAPVPVAEGISQAFGGGPSFIGGTINEIPISRLSLSDIVDRFDVTASQAANIQAEAQNNFGDTDFGTNTGRGIGSIISNPDIGAQLGGGNVSNPDFEGLSLTEIAQRLTGGNINNF